MTAETRITLHAQRTAPRLLSPLAGFDEVTSPTEYRADPLTGRTTIVGLNLAGKRSVLYSETDETLLQELARRSRAGCFFCPERVEQVTPRFPADIIPRGRLRRGACLLFPNLFPLTDVHAVVALGEAHFLWLDEFDEALLQDGLGVAVELVRACRAKDGAPQWWTICSNYLPPGGASIVHPHLQVLGSTVGFATQSTEVAAARRHLETHGTCFFEDLVEFERERRERFISRDGPVTWLAAWAPRGNSEIVGICDGASTLCDLTEDHLAGLARGLARGLRAYRRARYSTFNLALYAAPDDGDDHGFRVYASLVSRQSLVENYRCDDYFLQKMLGSEIVIDSPEDVAAAVRDEGA